MGEKEGVTSKRRFTGGMGLRRAQVGVGEAREWGPVSSLGAPGRKKPRTASGPGHPCPLGCIGKVRVLQAH